MRSFNMIAGLPRAGSTLLCQILSSNPEFHVTPTSGVLDMLRAMRSIYSQNPTWRAQDRLKLYENFKMGLQGFVDGFFHDAKVVFDKNRGWPSHLLMLDTILDNDKSKIIWLYRDPAEIISSIEAQHQRTILMENMDEGSAPGAFMTLDRRIGTYANADGLIAQPVEMLKDAIEMGYFNRIFFVKYYDLTNNTQKVMNDIHEFLGEPKFEYNIEELKQLTWEFDGIYNYKFLHKIKEGKIEYKKGDYKLEPKFIAAINERFAALNNFILNGDPSALLNLPPQTPSEDTGAVTQPDKPKNPFIAPGTMTPPPDKQAN